MLAILCVSVCFKIEGERPNERRGECLVFFFYFLLAKSEFYLHLASWQVVIRTPADKHFF
jgi:hypothetical protein